MGREGRDLAGDEDERGGGMGKIANAVQQGRTIRGGREKLTGTTSDFRQRQGVSRGLLEMAPIGKRGGRKVKGGIKVKKKGVRTRKIS